MSKRTSKKKVKVRTKNDDSDNEGTGDIMKSLMSSSQFDDKPKKKKKEKKIKRKDIEINLNEDDTETVLEKIVLSLAQIRKELDDLRLYSEGTFCTSAEFNRHTENINSKMSDISERVETLEY